MTPRQVHSSDTGVGPDRPRWPAASVDETVHSDGSSDSDSDGRMTTAGASVESRSSSTDSLEFWSMTRLPLSEVKARLSEIAEGVASTHERVQITRNGRDYVVLLAAEDLESIEATLQLLGDPDAQSRIARAEEEIERGDVMDETQLRALLAAWRAGSAE